MRLRIIAVTMLVLAAAAKAQVIASSSTGATATPAAATISKSAANSNMGRHDIRAQLMPRRYTTIAAEIGAKVSAIAVTEGGAFRAGQWLVQFDCSIQKAQMDKAQAELDGAEQTLRSNLRLEQLNSVGQLELDLSKSAVGKAKAEMVANMAVLAKCQVSPCSIFWMTVSSS